MQHQQQQQPLLRMMKRSGTLKPDPLKDHFTRHTHTHSHAHSVQRTCLPEPVSLQVSEISAKGIGRALENI